MRPILRTSRALFLAGCLAASGACSAAATSALSGADPGTTDGGGPVDPGGDASSIPPGQGGKDGGAADAHDHDAAPVGDGATPLPEHLAVMADNSQVVGGDQFACGMALSGGTLYILLRREIRKLVSTTTGATALVATLPSGATGFPPCGSFAVDGSDIYVVRPMALQGEIFTATTSGGAAVFAGTIPAETVSASTHHYGIAVDASDVYISGKPNVWRLPRAGGAPTKFAIGTGNYYAQELLGTPDALFTYSGNPSLTRIDKSNGHTLGFSSQEVAPTAFVLAGGSIYSSDHVLGWGIERTPVSFTAPPAMAISDGATGLATDGTSLVATIVTKPGSQSADTVAVYSLATHARTDSFVVTVNDTLHPGQTVKMSFPDTTLAVDATHLYALSGARVLVVLR